MISWIIRVTLFIICVASLTYLWYIQNYLDSFQKANPKDYISNEKNKLGKVLVIYHDSLHHTMAKRVELMAKTLNKNGYDVTTDLISKNENYDLNKYSVLVLASPVYLGNFSKAFKKYVEKNNFVSKKVLILLMGMDDKETKELDNFEEVLPKNNFVYKLKFSNKDENVLVRYLTKKLKK